MWDYNTDNTVKALTYVFCFKPVLNGLQYHLAKYDK